MPRIRLLSDDELDPELRTWLDGTDQDWAVRAYGHTPDFAKAFDTFYRPLRHASRLSPELKELVRLKVADLNGCVYWRRLRDSLEGSQILPEEKVRQIADYEHSGLSDKEKGALRFAEKIVTDHHGIDDALFDQLRRHFTEPEIVELGWAVGSFLFRGRLNTAFGLE